MMRNSWFQRVAKSTSRAAGHPRAFLAATLLIVVWLAAGPVFQWSDTWQLVINTATTIATFLMVFLIQNTQNRDTAAIQLKLDEIIRSLEGAHNALLDLEELHDDEIEKIRKRYEVLAKKARAELRRGGHDTGSPEVAADA
ncbi:MAG: low affinity iron permease family protein [Candidatus Eiseniibacteriota bacterium]